MNRVTDKWRACVVELENDRRERGYKQYHGSSAYADAVEQYNMVVVDPHVESER